MNLLLNKLTAAAALLVASAPAFSATYAIDPSHTGATFEALHFGASTLRGRFATKEGTINYDAAAKTGTAEIILDMTAITTGVAPFETHLKSKDFFNVAEFPTARFSGEKFNFDGSGKLATVSGTLTLVGKTAPVTLKANNFNCFEHPRLKREVCGADFETTIERSQFGITYGSQISPDKIRVLIQVEAVKQ